ncbi:hypothetical protein GF325_01085 [Candidatus Bathyarchaeota archaeon]|nr:hypothetical protein [Candidatus Bathyarchaeota archaeon]
MLIEGIIINQAQRKVFHYSSTETREIKLGKKDPFAEGLEYLQEYLSSSGFKILQVVDIHKFVLVKE